mgnify:CR=1 FL=1
MKKFLFCAFSALFFACALIEANAQIADGQTQNLQERKLTKEDKQMLKDSLEVRRRRLLLERNAEKEFWKNERKKSKSKPVTEEDVIYIFGVGTNFNDSTVYLTEVTPVNGLRLDPKTKFLPARSDFSLQFREYLEGQLGLVYETTCVFFSEKRSKALKYAYKLRKRYLDQGYQNLIVVDSQKFSFKLPDYLKNQVTQTQQQ